MEILSLIWLIVPGLLIMKLTEPDVPSNKPETWFSWQQDDCRMKFHQRLVVIAASSIVVVTYLMYLADIPTSWSNNHVIHLTYRDSPLRGLKYFNNTYQLNDFQKCSAFDNLKSEPNITLALLREKSDYKLGNGGNYILPTLLPGSEFGDHIHPLKVIVMPHSHNDAGWLRTLEEYYVYTTKNILNNMVEKLRMYPNMTFVWAEAVFLNIWWNELEDDMKVQVRRLIKNGQLEIVSGGWVMPDEASTSYYSIIDQLMEGHQWIMENLHVKPKNSWSIDPFGHSGTMPYLWKEAGLQNMVIQRIHQATKGSLAELGGLEFLWRQPWDAKGNWDMLCHVMPYMLYTVKHTCGPTPYVCVQFDFHVNKRMQRKSFAEPISVKNVETQAKYLYEQYRRKASLYNYDTILVPLGDDFRYDSAQEWDQQYQNYNLLMKYMNARDDWKIDVQFGTLDDYFHVLKKSQKKKAMERNDMNFPTVSGDFFPYSDKGNAYWSGYFTTRPHDKKFCREVERNLHAADILNTLVKGYGEKWGIDQENYHDTANFLQQSRRNLALFMHHDAITGTSKEYVMQDYENKLYYSYNSTQKVIANSAEILLSQGRTFLPHVFEPEEVKLSYNSPTEKRVLHVKESGTRVVLFNSLAKPRVEFTRLIVDTDKLKIKTSNYDSIPYQLNPVWETSTSVDQNKFEIVFLKKLEPLSLESVFLIKTPNIKNAVFPAKVSVFNSKQLFLSPKLLFEVDKPWPTGSHPKPIILENENIKAAFDSKVGLLQYVTDKKAEKVTKINLKFMHYQSQGSGAYLFYPNGEAKPLELGIPIIHVIEGPFMSQIEAIYQNIRHVVVVYSVAAEQARGFHIQNFINMRGNSVQDLQDMEIVMRIHTDIKNDQFFTDQNGFQLIGRKSNAKLYIEANYYPITNMGIIEDKTKRLTLHSSQSHGVAALSQGQFEVMLDRKLLYDDERGLGEGVQDNRMTQSDFVLQLEQREDSPTSSDSWKNEFNHKHPRPRNNEQFESFTFPSLLSMQINDFLQKPIIKMFTTISTEAYSMAFTPTEMSLPCDISLVHMKNIVDSELDYKNTSVTLHRRGYKCGFPVGDIQCPMGTTPRISSLLKDVHIDSVREVTLTHMYGKQDLSSRYDLHIPAMQLASYEISLRPKS